MARFLVQASVVIEVEADSEDDAWDLVSDGIWNTGICEVDNDRCEVGHVIEEIKE